MYEKGCAVVPQDAAKRPIVKWAKYQDERPTPDDLYRWAKRRDVVTWGLVAGQVSGIDVLDFDKKHGGLATFLRLGLKAMIATPGGGRHVYVKAPPHKVKTLTQPGPDGFPGMELKADGSLCTFYSRDPNHPYRPVADRRMYRADELPSGLAALFEPYRRTDHRKTADVAALKDRPLPAAVQLAIERLQDVSEKEEGRQWEALCPCHDDTEPSFGIGLGNDRLIVAHCFGCDATVDDIASALEIDTSEFSRKPWDSAWQSEPAYQIGADIPLTKVRWLWRWAVPLGKLTIFEGDPGKGKSVVTMDVAARVTMGRDMPDGQPSGLDGPYAVLIISGEDDYSDTIKPRLLAAGVNENRVVRLTLEHDDEGNAIPLTLPTGLTRIREAIAGAHRDLGLLVKLIVIDPITNFLADRTNSNVDPSVRAALYPLSELAQELDVAILLVRHLNKAGEMKAIYRGGGSIAFVAMARSAYVFEQHPDQPGTVVMAPVKANLVPRNEQWSYTYHLENSDAYDVPEVRWGEQVRMDADTLLRGHDGRKDAPERERAKALIVELLEKGALPAKDMEEERKLAGIGESTWKSAKSELGVVSVRERDDKGHRTERWLWRLPIEPGSNVIHFERRVDKS